MYLWLHPEAELKAQHAECNSLPNAIRAAAAVQKSEHIYHISSVTHLLQAACRIVPGSSGIIVLWCNTAGLQKFGRLLTDTERAQIVSGFPAAYHEMASNALAHLHKTVVVSPNCRRTFPDGNITLADDLCCYLWPPLARVVSIRLGDGARV